MDSLHINIPPIMVFNNIDDRPPRQFDLEERTFQFSCHVRLLMSEIQPNTITYDDKRQLIRSSGSVASHYIEANESLSRKDFFMRIKICKKEAKESLMWLRLISNFCAPEIQKRASVLIQEAMELGKIFGAISKRA